METELQDHISVDGGVHFGQPVVKGTRIPVYCVLELVKDGHSFDDIIKDYYPALGKEDIQACLDYASRLVREEEVHLSKA